jgi:hypothetical protein
MEYSVSKAGSCVTSHCIAHIVFYAGLHSSGYYQTEIVLAKLSLR